MNVKIGYFFSFNCFAKVIKDNGFLGVFNRPKNRKIKGLDPLKLLFFPAQKALKSTPLGIITLFFRYHFFEFLLKIMSLLLNGLVKNNSHLLTIDDTLLVCIV